jgi:hypothetical protein
MALQGADVPFLVEKTAFPAQRAGLILRIGKKINLTKIPAEPASLRFSVHFLNRWA